MFIRGGAGQGRSTGRPIRRSGGRGVNRMGGRHMPNTAREIMSGGVDCIGENETVAEAARKMAQLGVGALPICGEDDRLKGMLTDRDIVVKVIAEGKDPNSCRAGELAQGKPV